MIVAEFCSLFFAKMGLFLSVYIFELRIILENSKELQFDWAISIALFYNTISTIFLILSIYIRYDIWLQWSITIEKYTIYDTIYNTGIWKNMLVEIVVNILAPTPFFDGWKYTEKVEAFDTEVQYEVNDILLFLSFARLYKLVEFILYQTEFMNPRAQRVCSLNGCEAGPMFALKSLMQ